MKRFVIDQWTNIGGGVLVRCSLFTAYFVFQDQLQQTGTFDAEAAMRSALGRNVLFGSCHLRAIRPHCKEDGRIFRVTKMR